MQVSVESLVALSPKVVKRVQQIRQVGSASVAWEAFAGARADTQGLLTPAKRPLPEPPKMVTLSEHPWISSTPTSPTPQAKKRLLLVVAELIGQGILAV